MTTLRFEPIATQIGKQTSPAALFPADALEAIRRNEILSEVDPAWTPAMLEFMSHYAAVIEIAHLLLGAPAFERLARVYDKLKAEYNPEQQASPVYDSHLVQHVLGGVPQGLAGETPFGVLARLALGDAARARVQEMAHGLSRAHLDLYRVTQASELAGEVAPLRGGEPFALHVTGPFLAQGDLLLARVVEFGGRRFLADPPYLLESSGDEWLEYFARLTEAAPKRESSSSGEAPLARPKLTSKQAARRRKELEAKAKRNTPSERVQRHLRHGSSERFWLEYVMAAATGVRGGLVRLAGVPDRLEALPRQDRHEGSEVDALDDDALDGDEGPGELASETRRREAT